MYRTYLELVKPGIVAGNLISLAGGYLLASQGVVDASHLALVISGAALVIGSGCAANNVIDRDIDRLMERTYARPMATGSISIRSALAFTRILALIGFSLLYAATHRIAPLFLMLIGYVVYVGLYSLILKRRSVHATLVGSISGAIPPVVGYCSVRGTLDTAAVALFVIFGIWQMPHSYAIALFRWKDYEAASIPVLPLVKGRHHAKRRIVLYIAAFIAAALALPALGYVGNLYLSTVLLSGVYWLKTALAGFSASDDARWARRVFAASIAAVVLISVAMSIDAARGIQHS
ncbi:Protoheme IX farnesyltransferase [Achromobacter sp. 2789STDY5608633]|uniref:heme o synthase n=1 Tax=Achromobacter sp. 2789STDY5608633 TaxID=1806501 RepID=UPI0006C31D21|nr:heme o synthase [Achromobacter sp. 2789STDY5608633]CUJ32061.1 Protoheme IX farnesyltransferase [Achromobacter sp. 2789STDY5608633]